MSHRLAGCSSLDGDFFGFVYENEGWGHSGDAGILSDDGYRWPPKYQPGAWYDSDTYRAISLVHRNGKPIPGFNSEDEIMAWSVEHDKRVWDLDGVFPELQEATRLLRRVIADLAPDVTAVSLSLSGRVAWTSTFANYVFEGPSTYYPSVAEYQFPPSCPPLPVVTRAELTVLDRLSWGVDKVCSDTTDLAVFKYNPFVMRVGGDAWDELQIIYRLPRNHANILTPNALVVEELTGLGVVGFTTPFIPTPTLSRQSCFKLAWLRQLMSLIDELHFDYGIHHCDIADRNVFVHPDKPDEIILFDFNFSHEASSSYADDDDDDDDPRDDIKGLIILTYTLITRDPEYKLYFLPSVDEQKVLAGAPGSWVKHPEVQLDADISVYYNEVMEWARKRRDGRQTPPSPPTHPIRPANRPVPPTDVVMLDGLEVDLIGLGSVMNRRRVGRPVLNWRRPPRQKLDPSRPILATGRYADEQGEYDRTRPEIAVPDPMRGFPQPPVVSGHGEGDEEEGDEEKKGEVEEEKGETEKKKGEGEEDDTEDGTKRAPKRKRSDGDPVSATRARRVKEIPERMN